MPIAKSGHDVEIHYDTSGEGRPVVLLMGIGYDSSLWGLHQVPAFSRSAYTVTLDNRDSGRSSRCRADYEIADMADDVVAVLDDLGLKRASVVGISMGGMIALDLALAHPERVDRLVLSGTGAATARAMFDPISSWSFVKRHDDNGLAFAAQQLVWLFSTDFARDHAAVDQTLTMLGQNPHPMDADAYERQAAAYVKHDVADRLSEIRAPTLVIAGERDRLTPPWICREVADGIEGARFELVGGPGSSHVLPLERPEDFNEIVTTFLDER
jgi:pimeloyl-ACP methyl ester carboxylesterase